MEFEITWNLNSVFSIYSTTKMFFNIIKQISFSLRFIASKLKT